MELKNYFLPLRRWAWLLIAATLVSAISSFLVTLQQPPVYQARTTLMIGRAIVDPNPTANEFWLGQQLAGTYADIANRELVRNETMAALGWNWLPEYRARALNNTQIIEIVVTDVDPERAAIVANELANQLILQSPTSVRPEEQNRQEFVNQQLDTLQAQIQQTEDDIQKRQEELGSMVSARQITDTQNQIAALQTKLATLQGNYANLLSNTQRGAVNTLSVIEPAVTPNRPIGPAKAISILVAAVLGFALASSAAYLLEYLDDTLKSPDDVKRVIDVPVIGYLAELDASESDRLIISANPRHPMAEAYRSIRTNLEFLGVTQPLKSILVSSTDTEEGKTSIATNLALAMAQNDKRVILIDADLRNPAIHKFLDIDNETGLSDIFLGKSSLHNAIRVSSEERVAVITAGAEPPNPSELLASRKMDEVLSSLEDIADIVIVDGPPFILTDAAVLGPKVDGVLLVVRPGFTRQSAAQAMMEQIKRSGARILGVVLNRIPDKLSSYYGGRLYQSNYYGSRYYRNGQPEKTDANGGQGWQKRAFRYASDLRGTLAKNHKGRGSVQHVETPKISDE